MNQCLTYRLSPGMVAFPEDVVRRSNRLSVLPRNGKSIAAYSAVKAPIVSSGRLSHIGGEASSVFREGTAVLTTDRGGLFPRLFYSQTVVRYPMSDLSSFFQTPVTDSPKANLQNLLTQAQKKALAVHNILNLLIQLSGDGTTNASITLDDAGVDGFRDLLRLLADASFAAFESALYANDVLEKGKRGDDE